MANICMLVFMLPLVLSCCIPAQWEGNLDIKFGVMDYGQLSPGWEFYNVSFDAISKKIAMVGHIGFEHSEWFEQILQDFSSGNQYAVKAGTCIVTKLTGPIMTCLPSNATIVRSTYFGIGKARLNVESYEFIKEQSSLEISVVKDECVPVTEFVNYNGTVAEFHYLEVTPGIRNMKVFDVPLSCQNTNHIPYASLNVSYDITINKVAMFGETRKDGNLIKTQILQDFTAGKQYVVEHDKCTVSNTVGQMSNCIPANSTKPTSSYNGFLSHKLDVDTYQYRTSAGEVVQVTVTKVNPKDNVPCALIGTFVKTDGPPSANNSLRIIGTSGITQMIRNQTVFDIPTACLHGAVKFQTGGHRFHAFG